MMSTMNIIDINYLAVVATIGLFLITAAYAVINSFCKRDSSSRKRDSGEEASNADGRSMDKINSHIDRMLEAGLFIEAYEHVLDMKTRAIEERNMKAIAVYRKYERLISRLLTDSSVMRINAA